MPTNCKLVNKHTRAGRQGKMIICPECDYKQFVYHFAWSALGCLKCNAMVNKNEWRIAS